MPRWLKHLVGALWLSAAVAVILAAVLTVVARQLLPMVPHYRAQIEAVASDWLHHPVRIGGIQVGWHWITPTVTLEHVRVLDDAGKTALQLSRVGLRLGVWNSLLAGRPVPGEIDLQGARVVITRAADGRLSISGLALPLPGDGGAEPTASGARLPAWVSRIDYRLGDARVVIDDVAGGRRYRFTRVTLVARPTDDGIDLAGRFALPARLGSEVGFAADLRRRGAGDAAVWGGSVYLDLQGIRLQGLPLKTLLPELPPLRGQVDARVWSVWTKGRLARVSGHLSVQNLALPGPTVSANAVPPALTAFSGDLRWQAMPQGWRLQGAQLRVSTEQSAWPVDGFDVSFAQHDGSDRTVSGWAGFLRLQDVAPLLARLPWLPDDWSDRLTALAPGGDLRDLRFALHEGDGRPPQLAVSADLQDVSLRPDGHLPGVDGLSGHLAMNPVAGSFDIDSAKLGVTVPTVFGEPLPALKTSGVLRWRRGEDGTEVVAPRFALSNQDLAVRGQLGLWLPNGGRPDLNLMLGVERAKVAAAPRYLPVKRLHPDLVRWLNKALQGGEVTGGSIVLRGDPGDFPFRHHRGVFDAELTVRDGTLDYFRDWPRLQAMNGTLDLHDFSLHAQVSQAQMLSSSLRDVTLDIPDLDHAVLGIQGSGSGPLGDVVTYLSHTPLGDGRKALFDEMRAGGQTQFDLSLSLPLRAAELPHWSLRGSASIDDGSFALPEQDFALSRMRGKLAFTQRSLSAKAMQAVFKGVPVTLGASTRSDGLATLTLDGHLSVARLFGKDSPIARYAQGDTDWRIAFTLPMTTQGYRRYGMGLTLVSGLQGVSVKLPAPLGKSAASARGLVAQLSLTHDDAPVSLRYGADLQGLFQLAGKTGCRHVVRGDLRLDAGAPVLPAKGVSVQGRLAYFNVDAWRRVLDRLPSTTSTAECPGGGASADAVRRLRMNFGELDVLGRRLSKVSLDATRQGGVWRATIDSDVISGKLQVPAALHGGTPVRFDLSRLDLDGGTLPASAGDGAVDPASLPALSGRIGELTVAGRRLRNVQLTTTPTREGMQIHLAEVDEPHLRARASGSWLREPGGRTTMQVQLEVDSDDAGKALDGLNVQAGLAGGKGHLSATLSWPGGPGQLGWGVLEGQARLDLKNGRLMEVNPGQTGRLLGLLNLAALPQRLSLNFGDVFDKGFAFNDMKSRFQLRDGNIYTQDTHISGSSANMSITGRVGMVARDYDAQVTIVPQVQSTVAIAGAVLGGPVTGAALFLLDRLLGLGKQINKAAEFRYRVTGPWDAPKIVAEDVAARDRPSRGRDAPRGNPF